MLPIAHSMTKLEIYLWGGHIYIYILCMKSKIVMYIIL